MCSILCTQTLLTWLSIQDKSSGMPCFLPKNLVMINFSITLIFTVTLTLSEWITQEDGKKVVRGWRGKEREKSRKDGERYTAEWKERLWWIRCLGAEGYASSSSALKCSVEEHSAVQWNIFECVKSLHIIQNILYTLQKRTECPVKTTCLKQSCSGQRRELQQDMVPYCRERTGSCPYSNHVRTVLTQRASIRYRLEYYCIGHGLSAWRNVRFEE